VSLKVFISFSGKDSVYIAELKKVLMESRLIDEVWSFNENQNFGSISEQVTNAMVKADLVLIIWSRNSFSSKYVLAELKFALDNGKNLGVMRLDDAPLHIWLTEFVAHAYTTDLPLIERWISGYLDQAKSGSETIVQVKESYATTPSQYDKVRPIRGTGIKYIIIFVVMLLSSISFILYRNIIYDQLDMQGEENSTPIDTATFSGMSVSDSTGATEVSTIGDDSVINEPKSIGIPVPSKIEVIPKTSSLVEARISPICKMDKYVFENGEYIEDKIEIRKIGEGTYFLSGINRRVEFHGNVVISGNEISLIDTMNTNILSLLLYLSSDCDTIEGNVKIKKGLKQYYSYNIKLFK
jgi:hypothetical protein